jgi:hypothetical protein
MFGGAGAGGAGGAGAGGAGGGGAGAGGAGAGGAGAGGAGAGGAGAGGAGAGGAGAGGAGAGGAGTGGTGQITINFDNLTTGTVVTSQYPGVTFSSNEGIELRAYAPGSFGNSLPNMLCAAPANGGNVTCEGDVILDFSPAVTPISFLALGANNTTAVARVYLYSGTTLLQFYDLIGGNAMASFVDVSGHPGVTRMVIDYISDGGGIGWDDFRFYR